MIGRTSLNLSLNGKVALLPKYYKGLQWTLSVGPLRWSFCARTTSQLLQACSGLFVDPIANPARPVLAMRHLLQRRRELPRTDFRDLLSRGAADRGVG